VIQGGTLTEDSAWQVAGTASRYVIANHFTVDSGTTLDIEPGVQIATNLFNYDRNIYDFTIDGTVNVTDASFIEYTDLIVRDGGTLNLTG
jgi:hypothetical protein